MEGMKYYTKNGKESQIPSHGELQKLLPGQEIVKTWRIKRGEKCTPRNQYNKIKTLKTSKIIPFSFKEPLSLSTPNVCSVDL